MNTSLAWLWPPATSLLLFLAFNFTLSLLFFWQSADGLQNADMYAMVSSRLILATFFSRFTCELFAWSGNLSNFCAQVMTLFLAFPLLSTLSFSGPRRLLLELHEINSRQRQQLTGSRKTRCKLNAARPEPQR